MKKIHVGSLILAAVAVTAVPAIAQAEEVFLDSTVPQVIQKISPGNIVTFKNDKGELNDYYVPDWMFSKYDLQVGKTAFLFNRNVIQGKLGSGYVDTDDKAVLGLDDFAYGQTRVGCSAVESPASRGLRWGSRLWYKDICCFSTIPVVGSMSFYQKKDIVVEKSEVPTIPPAVTTPAKYDEPVRGLW
ncbi:hypothetical protein V2H45_16565 [Tumidithrix elongata RA019]|uniref:Uncharacterized protein n=1 Tax=Tumidithrix elongata BACA0141 TaxID=2716417 RepID=A0AAW9PU84_9CYAN|nr:hypothetical protein [Tumidithrix elongata RA019]